MCLPPMCYSQTTSGHCRMDRVQAGNTWLCAPTENIITPTKNMIIPTENIITTTENIIIPTENIITTTENIIIPTENIITTTENIISPTENIITKFKLCMNTAVTPVAKG